MVVAPYAEMVMIIVVIGASVSFFLLKMAMRHNLHARREQEEVVQQSTYCMGL